MEAHLKVKKSSNAKKQNKNKLLSKLLSEECQMSQNEMKSNYFNSFIYTDHITNDAMTVSKDLVFKPLLSKSRFSYKENSNNITNSTMNECISLLKSTRKFHLSSLQSKIYKGKSIEDHSYRITYAQEFNPHKSDKDKLIQYIKKKKQEKQSFNAQKRILSKFLQNTPSISKKQCSTDKKQEQVQIQIKSQPKPNSQTNRLTFPYNNEQNKLTLKTLSFHKTQKLEHFKQVHNKVLKKQKKFINKDIRQFIASRKKQRDTNQFTETQILENANSELKYLVRKNGQYLITPNISKRLIGNKKNKQNKDKFSEQRPKHAKISRLSSIIGSNRYKLLQQYQNEKQSNIQDHRQEKYKQIKQQKYFKLQQLNAYNFKIEDENEILRKMKLIRNQENKQTQQNASQIKLIRAIEQGNYFKVEIQLSVNPTLLLTKQIQNKNNLLHICVMNNKSDIFEMILKKCRQNKIDLLSQTNKYGRNPLDLGNILSFFHNQSILTLISTVEKQRFTGFYSYLRLLQ